MLRFEPDGDHFMVEIAGAKSVVILCPGRMELLWVGLKSGAPRYLQQSM